MFYCSVVGCSLAAAQQATLIETDLTVHDSPVSYLAEPAAKETLALNANNGFFTKGAFKAFGKRQVTESDRSLIHAHFDYLSTLNNEVGSARWHFWVAQPGEVDVEFVMSVPQAESNASWKVSINGQSQVFTPQIGDETKPQDQKLTFRLERKGKHVLHIEKNDDLDTSKMQLHKVLLSGPSMEGARLLRARWRPKAIHTQYHSSTCEDTRLWVFESQSVSDFGSYAPITTAFGYFGGSFTANQTAAGNVNFSMWAANRKQEVLPPLESMPHLLATGNPQAEFSGFGHEGSGVKIRNWTPLDHQPKSLIQALRMEPGEKYNTFYGYLFDSQQDRWVLYAVGRRPVKTRKRRNSAKSNFLRASSFCEVPGPAQVERTGDMERVIRRRGWLMDSQQNWHRVDRQTSSTKKGVANCFIGAKDGWFLMGTGGMEMVQGKGEVKLETAKDELPSYLSPEKAKQLFDLPVVIDNHRVLSTAEDSASVAYELSKIGANGHAVLHYGPVDCMTFVARELHGTEKKGLSAELLSSDRTWAFATDSIPVKDNRIEFVLQDLKPNTKYYFRILVTSESGKSWEFQSGTLTTKSP